MGHGERGLDQQWDMSTLCKYIWQGKAQAWVQGSLGLQRKPQPHVFGTPQACDPLYKDPPLTAPQHDLALSLSLALMRERCLGAPPTQDNLPALYDIAFRALLVSQMAGRGEVPLETLEAQMTDLVEGVRQVED